MTQSVVSERLENPAYSGWKVSTIVQIGQKTDRLPIIRFVDINTYVEMTYNHIEFDQKPEPVTTSAIDKLLMETKSPHIFSVNRVYSRGSRGRVITQVVNLRADNGSNIQFSPSNLAGGDSYKLDMPRISAIPAR